MNSYSGRRESFGGVDAFSGENLVTIEDLKKPSHATHLLLEALVVYDPRRHLAATSSSFS